MSQTCLAHVSDMSCTCSDACKCYLGIELYSMISELNRAIDVEVTNFVSLLFITRQMLKHDGASLSGALLDCE